MPNEDIWLGGDPPIANRFLFEVDGVEIGIFKEVKGLVMEVKEVEIPEGGQNGFLYRVPGRVTWPNITFRRGLCQSDNLFDWISKTSGPGFAANQNSLARHSGAITAITATGQRLRSWSLQGVWPVKWRGPEFGIDTKTPLEEELEIAHQGFTATTSPIPQ